MHPRIWGGSQLGYIFSIEEQYILLYARRPNRGVGAFEATDSAKDKVTFLYRLLVHDKLIQPLAKGHEKEPEMRRKLALWISRQLPPDTPQK